jgi:autotransporter-associated beta strand protein
LKHLFFMRNSFVKARRNFAFTAFNDVKPAATRWQARAILAFIPLMLLLVGSSRAAATVAMIYGSDGNDFYQFTAPSMSTVKASGFTTLIMFNLDVQSDGTLTHGSTTLVTNGVYVGDPNWGANVTTVKTLPTTVNRYEVCVGGWLNTSYNNIKTLVNSQGTGASSILYKNFQALKNAVPGIDAINDDDELTYDVNSSTAFANMLGGLGMKFTLVPYNHQSFWVNLKNNLTNCDYVYLQCYQGGYGNDPGQWNAAFGGSSGFSLSGFHVIPGLESNDGLGAGGYIQTEMNNWYLGTGCRGGFLWPDLVLGSSWASSILDGIGQLPLVTLTNSDAGAGSSFNAAGSWSDGNSPSTANAYVDSGFVLNTPTSGNPIFSGYSLLLNNGAYLNLKNNGGTTTIGNSAATGLTLDYGATVQIANAGATNTLAGYLAFGPDGGGNLVPGNGVLNVSAVIGGTGSLTIPSGNIGTVILSGANTFTGTTTVNGGVLQLQNINSLAANSLTLKNGSTLQLRSNSGVTFNGGDGFNGLGNASVTFDVDQLTGEGANQTLGFAPDGFNIGNTTLNFTGGHGYSLALGALTAAYAGPLTLNSTTANVSLTGIFGGAKITQFNKIGAGVMTLSGVSTYTGSTLVKNGMLTFGTGASGVSGSLQISNGAVCQILTSLPALTNTADVSISAGGQMYLASGVNLAVGNLVLNGISQAAGTWGSSSSVAANQNDAYFSGPGILWVGVTPPVPAPPTGVSAIPGNAQVTLSWTPASGATGYNVKRSTVIGGETTVATTTGPAADTYTDTGLANGTTYYYVVSAVNSGGQGTDSTEVNATPKPVVTLANTDTYGTSSFNTAGNWSSSQAPSSANNYVNNGYVMRTPTSGSPTFAGNSLLMNNGASLYFKNGSGNSITIGSSPATGLTLDNASAEIVDTGSTYTLAGYVSLAPGGGSFEPDNGLMTINAVVGGSGALSINNNSGANTNGTVILAKANSYTGGTILNEAATLQLSGTGTLGYAAGALWINNAGHGYGKVDLNGSNQQIGNLFGSGGVILNNAANSISTLTVGNGDSSGGIFQGGIVDGSGLMALVKTGAGIQILSSGNGYTGGTTVSNGALIFGSGSSGISSSLLVADGAVCQVLTTNAVLNGSASVSISAGGRLFLTNGVSLLISNLVLNSVTQADGTWGSSSSAASNKNDGYFSGAGILLVNSNAVTGSLNPTNLLWTGGGTVSNPAGGTWNTTIGNNGWNNGIGMVGNTPWSAAAASMNAVFGGTDGACTIALGANVSATNVIFLNSGYALSASGAQTITLTSSSGLTTPQVQIAPAKTNTIGTNVALQSSQSLLVGAHGSDAGGTLILANGGSIKETSSGRNLAVDGAETTVRVQNGGTFQITSTGGGAETLSVGITAGSGSTLSVEGGTVSTAGAAAVLNVGNAGNGTLTVSNGTVNVASGSAGIVLGAGATGSGTINLSGGMIITPQVSKGAGGSAEVNFNGGTLKASADNATFINGLDAANVLSGGAVIDSGGYAVTISQPLFNGVGADGGLVKLGTGALLLNNLNTYNGPTLVSAGTLSLTGSGSIANSSVLTINDGAILDVTGRSGQMLTLNSGQTLTGGGMLNGALTTLSGSTLNPGNTVGTLTIKGNIVLNGTTVMEINRTNSQTSDQLAATTGSISGGGILTVTNLGPGLQTGDIFQLFNQTVTGFTTINLPAGYVWSNNLMDNGTIQVLSIISTNAISLVTKTTSDGLVISWPADHVGWRLLSCPNLSSGNWIEVANSVTTNRLVIPIISTNAAIFYKLAYP